METVSAKLSLHRQSPRKVRLVADLIRGKKVKNILEELDFLNKKAALPFKKLVNSAVANAKNLNFSNPEDLFVKTVLVDEGQILYRRRFRARGRVMPIRKRTSSITIVLAEKAQKNIKSEAGSVEKQSQSIKSKKTKAL